MSFIDAIQKSYTNVDVFSGYNHALRTSDGEMYDMENMCGDRYPFLSTRQSHSVFKNSRTGAGTTRTTKILNVAVCDAMVDGALYSNAIVCLAQDHNDEYCLDIYDSKFDYTGKTIMLPEIEAPQEKMVVMNGFVIFFPSGFYINLFSDSKSPKNRGFIEAEVKYTRPSTEASANVVATTFSPCTEKGETITINDEKPASPKSGDYWSDGGSLKVYNATYKRWDSVVLSYTKMIFPDGAGLKSDDFAQFSEGDYLEIGEISSDGVTKRRKQFFKFISDDGTASASADVRHIILQGEIQYSSIASDSRQSTQQVYIKRPMPKLQHVFQHNNRLWGCGYGVGEDGTVLNEIYASALGDFRSWYRYEGISTDSFTATVSAPGKWTGGISYGGYPMFFKEKSIFKIYGSAPSSFQTHYENWRGVKDGAEDSLAIVDEILFYLTESGVVSYSGAVPQNIDGKLRLSSTTGVGCGCRGKYFFKSGSDIFCFDTRSGMWFKYTVGSGVKFRTVGDNIFMFRENGGRFMYGTSDIPVEWYCETANIGFGDPDHKYISRIQARMRLEQLCEMRMFISYDGGEWERIGSFYGNGITHTLCEVRPVRCGYFRLRFEGKGDADLIQFSYLTEEGSSNYVN